MNTITTDCPLECLTTLLSQPTLDALIEGIEGSPATVGQVVELYEQGKLMSMHNISSGRLGEIRRCLAAAGFIAATAELLGRRRGERTLSAQYQHDDTCQERDRG